MGEDNKFQVETDTFLYRVSRKTYIDGHVLTVQWLLVDMMKDENSKRTAERKKIEIKNISESLWKLNF